MRSSSSDVSGFCDLADGMPYKAGEPVGLIRPKLGLSGSAIAAPRVFDGCGTGPDPSDPRAGEKASLVATYPDSSLRAADWSAGEARGLGEALVRGGGVWPRGNGLATTLKLDLETTRHLH